MTTTSTIFSLILLFAFTLIHLAPTNGLPVRSRSCHDGLSRKEPSRKDDRLRRKPYYREPYQRKPYESKPSQRWKYSDDDRLGKDSYHRNNRQKRYDSVRKSKYETNFQHSYNRDQFGKPSYRQHRIEKGKSSDQDLHAARFERKSQERSSMEPSKRKHRLEEQESELVRTSQKDLESSQKEIKRLHKQHEQFTIPRLAADRANIPQGHTNRNAWAGKFAELEKAKSNIRRHEKVGKYLQHVPGVSQALHEQADRLQIATKRIESDMAKLKSDGKHDQGLEREHDSEEYLERLNFQNRVEKHQHIINLNESIVRNEGKPKKL